MLVYKASYKYLSDGVHGEVVDFPGVITCGRNLNEARRLLEGALEDMAETNVLIGEPLPKPDPKANVTDSDIDEPIHLILNAATRIRVRPRALV